MALAACGPGADDFAPGVPHSVAGDPAASVPLLLAAQVWLCGRESAGGQGLSLNQSHKEAVALRRSGSRICELQGGRGFSRSWRAEMGSTQV
mgnify:CR=1 FL=1